MEMFTHHTDLLEGKEVTQGLGEAGFEFLFPETKSLPSPLPRPHPSPSIPLPLVLEAEESMLQFCSPLASGSPPCRGTQGVWEGVRASGGPAACETWFPVSTSLLPQRMAFLLSDPAWVYSPDSWLACPVMGLVTGSCDCFNLGCGQLLSQESTPHSGIWRWILPKEIFYLCIKKIREIFPPTWGLAWVG